VNVRAVDVHDPVEIERAIVAFARSGNARFDFDDERTVGGSSRSDHHEPRGVTGTSACDRTWV
jgi:hypothetical protein